MPIPINVIAVGKMGSRSQASGCVQSGANPAVSHFRDSARPETSCVETPLCRKKVSQSHPQIQMQRQCKQNAYQGNRVRMPGGPVSLAGPQKSRLEGDQ